ncbi:MAG TPA: cbb3-type cytochrome c oxidase subunit I [Chitinophagales bacterium]|nr:cbb3-type cytochrome c oxidase subunit I [Chitinophagales bacterium]HMZ88732.1 cbb3-type cytochrome c oxidase subunit I [Chitinophagales bacterium]HNE45605.1 cbb3-type cytochrome c oxidase subunit I [Chitinophagales bacterium]HNF67911.1 cbb3-type cytochrome c oxidase subunit I [Chitinophagales bacterium]HNI53653.1 cbb3-type cytochrome c oxidase subunit I [Chitinophagales bacterium]
MSEHHAVAHHTEAHAHGHDHHGHDGHHELGFIRKYIFSEDHKTIAKQFLVTGIFWAIIGALLSVLFRIQLGYPNADLTWMKPFLGKWITEEGQIAPEFYNALITMHGTILVFFVLTAGLSGTFSNFLIPLMVGARDMASGFINMLSYWFFFISGAVMFVSFFLATGPASGGWTAYPPLNALHDASSGGVLGVDYWLISMALFIVSALLGGLNYITTVINLRTKGMKMFRLPLPIWAFFLTAVIGVLSFPVLLSAAILLLFDRNLGTSFYLDAINLAGEPLANSGGSPILYQHLFWFLGHPEVYIIILPAMGIVSEVLSVHSRKPIFGYTAMIYSLLAITVLSFIVWAHHMFMTGMNPFIGSIFVIFTLIIAVPSAIKVFNWLTTLWKGDIRLNPQMLFAIGFVSLFISGGLTGIFLGNSSIDIRLHDTYFVVAHFHLVMGVAAFFGMFAGVYHWFPKMFGRYLNPTLGYIHFWGTISAAYLIFYPMHFEISLPRRYYTHSGFETFSDFAHLNAFISTVAIISFALQLLFVFNFFYSIWYGRKLRESNPYGANTLEWTTPLRPGHGNWEGDIPEVHRWPYDYSKHGRDFIPQTEPLSQYEIEHGEHGDEGDRDIIKKEEDENHKG